MYWLLELKDAGKEAGLGNTGAGEATRSSSVTRLDEGVGPTITFVPERNDGNDCRGSTKRSSRGRCRCEPLRLV